MWTYPPRSILVPVDFGDASGRALGVASALAARFGATMVVVHAESLEAPPYFTHDQLQALQRQRTTARKEADRYLAQYVAAHAVHPHESRIVDGPAVPAVLALAQSFDLVVMGTHGRTGPTRWWMGSAAEQVARDSPIPVLVVRAVTGETAPSGAFRRTVVVAGPAFDGEARRYAQGLAETFGGTTGEKAVASLDELRCDPEATLMVVAVGRHHGRTWFGDATERLVRHCALPMLFVPAR